MTQHYGTAHKKRMDRAHGKETSLQIMTALGIVVMLGLCGAFAYAMLIMFGFING